MKSSRNRANSTPSKHANNAAKEPFGYKLTENGLEPVPEQLEALEQAKWYLYSGCSMQTTRDWLVKKTGRSISVPGMLKKIGYGTTTQEDISAWKADYESRCRNTSEA